MWRSLSAAVACCALITGCSVIDEYRSGEQDSKETSAAATTSSTKAEKPPAEEKRSSVAVNAERPLVHISEAFAQGQQAAWSLPGYEVVQSAGSKENRLIARKGQQLELFDVSGKEPVSLWTGSGDAYYYSNTEFLVGNQVVSAETGEISHELPLDGLQPQFVGDNFMLFSRGSDLVLLNKEDGAEVRPLPGWKVQDQVIPNPPFRYNYVPLVHPLGTSGVIDFAVLDLVKGELVAVPLPEVPEIHGVGMAKAGMDSYVLGIADEIGAGCFVTIAQGEEKRKECISREQAPEFHAVFDPIITPLVWSAQRYGEENTFVSFLDNVAQLRDGNPPANERAMITVQFDDGDSWSYNYDTKTLNGVPAPEYEIAGDAKLAFIPLAQSIGIYRGADKIGELPVQAKQPFTMTSPRENLIVVSTDNGIEAFTP